jgi:hypothetical protein
VSLDWKPAHPPDRAPLQGELVRLEPVDPARHAQSLFVAARGADAIWTHQAYGPFDTQAELTKWLEERAASKDPLLY